MHKFLRPILLIGLSVLVLALAVGCAARTQAPVAPVVLSPDDEAGYWYMRMYAEQENPSFVMPEEATRLILSTEPPLDVYADLAEHYWRRGRADESKAVLEVATSRYPDDFNMIFILAEVYMAMDNSEQAQAVVQAYLSKKPRDLDAAEELISLLVRNNKFREALNAARGISEARRTAGIHYWLGKAYLGLNQPGQAAAEFRNSIKLSPAAIDSWGDLGYALEQTGDLSGAEKAYSRSLDLGGPSEELFTKLIELNLKMKRPDKATQYLKNAPDSISFQLRASNMFMEAGYHSRAEKILNEVMKRPDAPPEVAFFAAFQAIESGRDYPGALRYLDLIPVDHPEYLRAQRFKCAVLVEQGQPDQAVALAVALREANPDDRESWLHEAGIRISINDNVGSLKTIMEALRKWPDDIELLFAAADAFGRLGNQDQALAYMERVLALEPDNPEAMNNVAFSLIEQNRDFQRAEDLLTRAAAIKPFSGYIIDSLAWLYYKQGRLDEAWETIQEAVKMQDSEPEIWDHYGDIATALGHKKEAAKGYRKAKELRQGVSKNQSKGSGKE